MNLVVRLFHRLLTVISLTAFGMLNLGVPEAFLSLGSASDL